MRADAAAPPRAEAAGHVRWIDLRPALRRGGAQLYRPARPVGAQARSRRRNMTGARTAMPISRWFSRPPTASASCVFGRIIDRIGARLGYRVAMTLWTIGHIGACTVHDHRAVHADRAPAARARRGGHLSRRARRRQRMVSQARARARDRHLQRRRQCRRDRHAADRARRSTLAFGWRWAFIVTGLFNRRLAGRLAGASIAARASIRRVTPDELAWIESRSGDRRGHARVSLAVLFATARPGPIWPGAS